MAARLFLFHGSDSRASGLEVRKWQRVFSEKYGTATRYSIDVEEGLPEALKELANAVEGLALFPDPKLITVRRVSGRDQGARSPASTAIVQVLERLLPFMDAHSTIAVWEERLLPETHPLLKAFTTWQHQGMAKISLFLPPGERALPGLISTYLSAVGKSISPSGIRRIQESYRALEKRQRQDSRLRSNQLLLEDERGWWIYLLLENMSLLETGEIVSDETVRRSLETVREPVGPFELGDALISGNWKLARRIVARLSEEYDDDYFALVAALKWRFEKAATPQSRRGLELLAQTELIMKNFSLPSELLLVRLIQCLESSNSQADAWIVPPRTLWLGHLARS